MQVPDVEMTSGMTSVNPRRIVCLSGKRKSGKDYIAEHLHAQLPGSIIIQISAPIKKHWAELKGLDLDQLLSDGPYKENYRAEMILWGEQKRATDPGFFCRSAIQLFNGDKYPIWIVSDLRRTTDLEFFTQTYQELVTSVRITASNEVRIQRGFVSTPGVDDAESECGLDHVTNWDLIIQNDGENSTDFQKNLEFLINVCKKSLE
nr:EOG090X0FYC [Scapholeberis mucronata]